jgi:hypothetical protein
MLHRSRILALLLGLGCVWLLTGPVAADKDDAARIDKLVEQLGSGSYQEREAATKALDAIGIPALDKLRQAMQGDDAEIKRRATDLVKRIEKRAEVSRVLTAKRVHLVYKNTPLKDALEDFKKKSGYDLVLHDPENKLTDRKVTLDTGDTTFWEALDQLCDKAGIAQVTQQDLMQQMMQEMANKQREMMEQQKKALLPAPPAKDVAPKEAPARPAPPAEEKPKPAPKQEGAAKPDENQAAAAARERAAEAALAEARARAQARAVLAQKGVMAREAFGGFPGGSPNQIVLMDGKRKSLPTHYAGTVRIRAVEPMQQSTGDGAPLLVQLQVSTEPKFQFRGVTSTRITKAVDDNGQSLSPITPADDADAAVIGIAPGGAVLRGRAIAMTMAYGMGGPGFTIIPLKKGEKPSKKLEELSGTLTIQMLDAPEALITVDDVLKAGGTATKGKAGGQLKVVQVTKTDNGQVKVQVQLDVPPDVTPAGNEGFSGGMMTMPAFRIKAALPAVPPPPPPPVEKPKDAPPKEEKAPAKEQGNEKAAAKEQAKEKAAAVPPPAARVVAPVIAAPAIAVGQINFESTGRYVGNTCNGLTLVDDKGKSWQIVNVSVATQVGAGGAVESTYLTFEAKEKQGTPAKLIFSGSKLVTVEVPFTLKGVAVQ